jgi:DNA polymerase III epsilon subunit-like protein
LDRYKKSPFLVVKGHGILVAQDAKIEVDEMLRCHVRVLSRIPSECDLDYLTESEISRLLNWEPEKYRLSLED